MILFAWIAAPALLRFASYLATGSPWGIAILDVRPWLIWLHPYVLVFAPYDEPDRVDLGTDLGFLAGCLVVSAALLGLASARIRALASRQPARAARRHRRSLRPSATLATTLDRNPLAWREWHRSRPAGMLRWAWRMYAAIGLLCVGVVVWPRPWNGPPGELPGRINGFMVSAGLLLLGVGAVSSLAEDRARGGLDMLRLLPVSGRSILAAKWWASFRRAPAVLAWPAATGLILAIRFGYWPNYVALLAMLPAYAAATVSLALVIAVWAGRPGRAIALFVTAYAVLMGVAPCVAGATIAAVSRHHGLFALVGSPGIGTHLLTVGVAQAEIVNGAGAGTGRFRPRAVCVDSGGPRGRVAGIRRGMLQLRGMPRRHPRVEEAEAQVMIPTRFRTRLPRGLSYPVGAEALSEALAGAPHVEAMSLMFTGQAVWPASEFRRVLAAQTPYRILEVRFRSAHVPGFIGSAEMIEKGWYDDAWEIIVSPVLSELRHLANRLLREQGLPTVARWLRTSTRPGRDPRPRWIELRFDPAGESLAAIEGEGV